MKKISLLTFILVVFVFILAFNSLHISATAVNETVTEDSNTELVGEEDASVASSGEGLEHPDNHGEKWYILSKDEPTFGEQDVTIDYNQMSELLTYLKPGDIIYETNDSIVGDITKHIAIVYDILWDEEHQQHYVSIIEAYTGGVGYGIMTPNRFEEKKVIIYRLTNASEVQIQNALIWLKDKCGDNFSFHPRKFLDGLQINDDTYWYCAELIWAAFMEQGIGLDPDNNENNGPIILPQKLASYEYLTTILHYTDENDEEKYKTTLTNNGATGHTYTCDGDTYTEEHFYRFWTVDDEETHSSTCACGYSIEAEHNFVYGYPTSQTHTLYCSDCGYKKEPESHSFQYTSNNDGTHTLACSICGHISTTEEHDYTNRYVSKDNLSHYAYCVCGSQQTLDHRFYETDKSKLCYDCPYSIELNHVHSYTYTPQSNGRSHTKSCRCGISTTERCIGMVSIDGSSRCSKCGQTMPSIPELLSVDEEEIALPYNKEDEDY